MHALRFAPRYGLFRVAFFAAMTAAVALGGCRSSKSADLDAQTPIGPSGLTATQLSAAAVSFADNLSSAMSEAYERAALAAATPQARAEILGERLRVTSAAYAIAIDMNPVGAALDMVAMVSLCRMVAETEESRQLYGALASDVIESYKRLEEAAWKLADDALDDAQLADLHTFIEQWRKEHPDRRYVAWVKLREFSDLRGQLKFQAKGPDSLLSLFMLDPMAGLDPATREIHETRMLADRISIYLKRAPLMIAWEIEYVYARLAAEPEVTKVLADIDEISGSSAAFAAATDRFSADTRRTLTEERKAVFEQLGVEREAIFAQFDAQQKKLVAELGEQAPTLNGLAQNLSSLSDSVRATLETIKSMQSPQPPAGTPPAPEAPPGAQLADVRATLTDTTAAAEKLNELVLSVNRLLDAADIEQRQAQIDSTLSLVEARGQRLVDRAFRLGAILVGLILAASIVRILIQKRLAAPRPAA